MGYKRIINKMRWSYSRLECYTHCPYEFFLQYIVADDDIYLSEGNYYAEVGSYVHEILEMIFNGKLSIDDAPEYYAEHYDENVLYRASESTMNKNYEACANYFAEVDFSWLKDFEILGVEKECNFTLYGYDFIGYIDLLLRDKKDGRIVIVDHKSAAYPLKKDGGVKKQSEKSFESYKRQMYLYSHAVYEMLGELPKEIWWNHFKEGKFVKIPFSQEELKASTDWAIQTIHDIESNKDFEAIDDYFYCHNLCNFRHSCEYKLVNEG
ncbi:MAG: PD-(D/E)XK nuclease family protein [Prevotella sp.]|nr:PD-(D/E)XK nuclease family protein [Prevotella sp.]